MPLHTQVDESSQDEGVEVNPVYVRELSCEIPRYLLPAHGVLPRTALQVVRVPPIPTLRVCVSWLARLQPFAGRLRSTNSCPRR